MKRKFWSLGSVLGLAIIILGLPALVYLIFLQDFGDKSPPFDELTIMSGQVENVELVDKYNSNDNVYDQDVYIKLRGLPTRFLYGEPYELEVYQALEEQGSFQLWVGRGEVWQVAVDSTVISSYQSRVAWGKSNTMVGKIFVSCFIGFFLAVFPGIYLYLRFKKARGPEYSMFQSHLKRSR